MDQEYVAGQNAATDDLFHQQARQQNQNISDVNYHAGYNEQIKGQRAQTTKDGHPEYMHAEKVQQNVSKTAYGLDAEKIREKMVNMNCSAQEIENALNGTNKTSSYSNGGQGLRMAQRGSAIAEMQRKSLEKFEATFAGEDMSTEAQQRKMMDMANGGFNLKHQVHAQAVASGGYGDAAREANQDFYNPVTMTQGYEQQRNLKNTLGGKNYSADADANLHKVKFPAAETDAYLDGKKLRGINSNYKTEYYQTKHENQMGKALAETAEVQQAMKNQNNLSDTLYSAGARQLRRQVQLNESPELAQAKFNAKVLSRKAYKEGYIAMLASKKDGRTLEDFPEYVKAKQLASVAAKKVYELEAKEKLMTPIGIDNTHESFQIAKKQEKIMRDSIYSQSRKDVIAEQKGYMTMPADVHPIVVQGNYKKAMMQNEGYARDAREEAREANFPVEITEGFQQQTKLNKIKSSYAKDAAANRAQIIYNAADTEKYEADKKLSKQLTNYNESQQKVYSEYKDSEA